MSFSVRARFEPCELKFKLTEPDKITTAIEQKIKKMGFPSFYGNTSAKCVDENANGVCVVPNPHEQDGIPISWPLDGGSFECNYSSEENSIVLKMEGDFFAINFIFEDEVDRFRNVAYLFVNGICLQDGKGKLIKLPKDEYGIACNIEANITGTYDYDVAVCYQIPVVLTVETIE